MPNTKSKKGKQEVSIVVKTKTPSAKATAPKPKKAKKSRRTTAKNSNLNANSKERSGFLDSMMAPDLTGPVRIPRPGGATRTILGFDKTFTTLGNATAFRLYVPYLRFNGGGAILTAASAAANWAASSTVNVAAQYPATTNVNDCNCTAAALIVDFIGAPLTAIGEILVGTVPNGVDLTASSFNTLANFPTVLRLPVKSLFTGSDSGAKRVWMRKISAVADEFVGISEAQNDTDIPFVACSPLGASGADTLTVYQARAWEVRATTNNGLAIPYEMTENSYSKDVANYQDTLATLSTIPITAAEAYGEYFREVGISLLGSNLVNNMPAIIGSASSMFHATMNRHMQRGGGGRIEL